jgi:hypothetical protein
MKSKEQKDPLAWLLERLMQIAPEPHGEILHQSLDPANPPGSQRHCAQGLCRLISLGRGRRRPRAEMGQTRWVLRVRLIAYIA